MSKNSNNSSFNEKLSDNNFIGNENNIPSIKAIKKVFSFSGEMINNEKAL